MHKKIIHTLLPAIHILTNQGFGMFTSGWIKGFDIFFNP